MSLYRETSWESPQSGFWQLDANHYPRPVTAFHREIFAEEFRAGMGPKTRDYGLLVDFDFQCVHGFMYIGAFPVGAPRDAKGPPPKWLFKLVSSVHPEIRRRMKAAARTFDTRAWRTEADRWETETKPAAVRAHLALQSVEPTGLPTDRLLAHLDRCREHVKRMIRQHHSLNLATFLPMGDFLAQASEWTGRCPEDLLPLMRGSSPVSAGVTREFSRLIAAIQSSPYARACLESPGNPEGVLAELQSIPGEVSVSLRRYLELVGYRLLGSYDMSDPYFLEMPDVLLRAIRSGVDGTDRTELISGQENPEEKVRGMVPDIYREAFDTLLSEAKHTYRLRDERGLYSDLWAYGLMRRAVLAAGRRVTDSGRLAEPVHLLDATYPEMCGLIRGAGGPCAEELATRTRERLGRHFADAPSQLGTPAPPPPLDWLPPVGQRTARAVQAVLQAIYAEPKEKVAAHAIHGLGVSSGVYEGIARVVITPADFDRLQRGDILVTRSTSAAFSVVLPLLGAIVTDRGGALSHAAIVAREYGIPAVVGTQRATQIVVDGARVRVDGTTGKVDLLT